MPDTTIGVISDTHGLLRPEAIKALRGSDLILHAGDIGSPEILPRLAELAPVVAVRGNVDRAAWAQGLPPATVVDLGGLLLYLLHDLDTLDLNPKDVNPKAAGFVAVISGHSHVPAQQRRHGVLYFNPGSAGPRRFSLPVSVGRLVLSGSAVRGELITLSPLTSNSGA